MASHEMQPKAIINQYPIEPMQRAAELSLRNALSGLGGPFGAVIVKDGRIIAEAANAVIGKCDPTAHAEVEAIRKAATILGRFDLSDCEIYTSAEPCPMCLGAIYWARLRQVYYANTRQDAAEIGFDDAFFYTELAKPISERATPMQHQGNATAEEAFKAWKGFAGKVEY